MIKKLAFNPVGSPFDVIDVQDHHSGFYLIPLGFSYIIELYKFMLVPNDFVCDGELVIEGIVILSGDF